jgi:hypothetical protein
VLVYRPEMALCQLPNAAVLMAKSQHPGPVNQDKCVNVIIRRYRAENNLQRTKTFLQRKNAFPFIWPFCYDNNLSWVKN